MTDAHQEQDKSREAGASSNGNHKKHRKNKALQRKNKIQHDSPKKKKVDAVQLQLVNQLLSREVDRLKSKVRKMKAMRPRRKNNPPSEKQKAQWAKFGDKVKIAKMLYNAMEEKSTKTWNDCMKKAGKFTPEKLAEAEDIAKSLMEGTDDISNDDQD